VPVLHTIRRTAIGLARYARIGYSRRSCYDAGVRTKILLPVLHEVSNWYYKLNNTQRLVDNNLYSLEQSSSLIGTIIFPVHCHKTVGLSPFIDGIRKMQSAYSLSKEHSTALCYNVITNECPFYFWSVVQDYLSNTSQNMECVKALSPVALRLEFHETMWDRISSSEFRNLPK
jgi:hypothetical protein